MADRYFRRAMSSASDVLTRASAEDEAVPVMMG